MTKLLVAATFGLVACGNVPSSEPMYDGGAPEPAESVKLDSNVPNASGARIGDARTICIFHADRHPRDSN